MDSYFFVPANLIHRIPFIKESNPDHIIIDLEDSIKNSQRELMFNNIKDLEDKNSYFFRVPVHNFSDKLDLAYIKQFVDLGLTNFVIPKLNSFKEFQELYTLFSDGEFKLILLIESPRFYLELNQLLEKGFKNLYGLGLGSHDFMAKLGGEHKLDNLESFRWHLLTVARALEVQAIDIASMELTDNDAITHEIKDGFTKGYDAKFLIHPNQLALQQAIAFYTHEDIAWAEQVLEILKDLESEDEFNPVVINGQVIEKPHLHKAKRIINYKLKRHGK